jgi:DNA-binding transcriptional regulator GbsR (MarR family)
MNVRALIEWGIVDKKIISGKRMDFYVAGKDIVEIAKQVAKERTRREIDPIQEMLNEVLKVKGKSEEVKEFKSVTSDLLDFANKSKAVLDKFSRSNSNWFYKTVLKFIK